MRVLIVEDELSIAQPLAKVLEKSNISSDVVTDGVSGLMLAEKDVYDVILLDIMLPEMDGLTVLKNLRAKSVATPVLLLTAKDSVEDKVTGLEYGADDYLTKPFSTSELIARIRALSRRRPELVQRGVLCVGDVTLWPDSSEASVAGQKISLTVKEVGMLELLMQNPNSVISKERLLDTVWGIDSEAIDNTVEIYMHYLRKKLSSSVRVKIVTMRGMGYILKDVT